MQIFMQTESDYNRNAMVDVQEFMSTFNGELQEFHSGWDSRIDDGATSKDVRLWANGYTVRVDLTEGWLDSGPKHDKLRMVIFRDSREPMSVGERTDALETKIWRSTRRNGETYWKTEDGAELTLPQVFSGIRAEFCRIVEAAS